MRLQEQRMRNIFKKEEDMKKNICVIQTPDNQGEIRLATTKYEEKKYLDVQHYNSDLLEDQNTSEKREGDAANSEYSLLSIALFPEHYIRDLGFEKLSLEKERQ